MRYFFIFILLFSCSLYAQDTTMTRFKGSSSTEDSYISNSATTTNYGTSANIIINRSIANTWHTIMRVLNYDDSIPTNAIIVACTLNIYVNSFSTATKSDTPTYIQVYKVCQDWVESQVTYNIYSTGNNWNTAGLGAATGTQCADCAGSDDRKAGFGIMTVNPLKATGWYKIPIEACLVQDWVDGENWNGVNIRGVYDFPQTFFTANITSENGSSSEHPYWDIYWYEAPESPLSEKRHSPTGNSVRHSVDGNSLRHGG